MHAHFLSYSFPSLLKDIIVSQKPTTAALHLLFLHFYIGRTKLSAPQVSAMSSNGMEKESSQPKTQRLSEATLPSSHEQAPSKTIAWGKKKNVDVNWLLKVYPSAKIGVSA